MSHSSCSAKRRFRAPALGLVGLLSLALGSGCLAAESINLLMRVSAAGHELVSAERFSAPGPTDTAAPPVDRPALRWQALSATGRVLQSGELEDPRFIRAPLLQGSGHQQLRLDVAYYLLRLPADEGAAELQLEWIGTKRAQSASTTPSPSLARIDLRPILAKLR